MARNRNKADWAAEITASLKEAAKSYKPSKKMGDEELQSYLASMRRNTSHGTRNKPREKSPRNWGD